MDKVVVITGASHGLGKIMAEEFAKRGAKVVVSARREKVLDEIAAEIGGVSIVADVTDEAAVKKLAEETVAKFGRIDIWINNAGIWLPHMPIEEVDMQAAHGIYEVNVFGTAYGCRSAIVQMKKQGGGMIINIGSTSGLGARPGAAMYAASKWAVRGLTDAIREEVRDAGIKVIAVHPGGMKTSLFDDSKPSDYNDFMAVEPVAEKIVENALSDAPEEELIIRRPKGKK